MITSFKSGRNLASVPWPLIHSTSSAGWGIRRCAAQSITLRSGIDRLHIGEAAQNFDRHELQQMLHILRRLAEAVMQFGAKGIHLVLRGEVCKPPVKPQTDSQIRDISSGINTDVPILICGDHWPSTLTAASPAALCHSFFQHVLVKLKTHFADVARLLFAQHVARATNIEVMAGQRKACAQ